jgi:hypothetical protein
MTKLALKLGHLKAEGFTIVRSSVRWLRESGQMCLANQPIAYCNITLEPTGARVTAPSPFAEEQELQVVLAPRVNGMLSLDPKTARGGYLSIRSSDPWDADTVIAHLETNEKTGEGDSDTLRHLMLAGRRMTGLADTRAGLLPGWHGRSRGWWSEPGEKPMTLLSLGVCDVTGVIQGEQCAFLEMFESKRSASQFVVVPDHPIAPCLPILLDQLERTPAQFQAMADDVYAYFRGLSTPPSPDDWMFIGTMLSVMRHTPIKDDYSIFSSNGIQRTGPADAVLVSLAVEPQSILRHRKLGYYLHVMRHYQAAAGPAVRTWLATAFETVKRPVETIQRDYERLIDGLHRTTGGHLMVLNRMSTSGYEDISSYMGFDAPLSDTLSNIAAKEWNLMLTDIAESRDVSIIDVDAMAAQLGGAQHLPDGIHQSGIMQVALRESILQSLSDLEQTQKSALAVH